MAQLIRACLLLLVIFAAIPRAGAQDAPQPAASPTSQAPVPKETRTPVRIDPAHPLKIGYENYPVGSRIRHEQGICILRVLVAADGNFAAFQLVSNTGYKVLDAACWNSIVGARMIPATVNGAPVATWMNLPITWHINGDHVTMNTQDFLQTPHFDADHPLRAGPEYYPKSLRQTVQLGTCLVHMLVSEKGVASDISVTKSTGFATLDQACVDAIQNGQFVPAVVQGKAIAKETEVAMVWRSP